MISQIIPEWKTHCINHQIDSSGSVEICAVTYISAKYTYCTFQLW